MELTVHQYQDASKKCVTQLEGKDIDPEIFGLMWVDALRHMAAAMNVPEERIWAMVDKERNHPTTEITELKPN